MKVDNWIELSCHPATPTEVVRAIQVRVSRSADAKLRLAFRLDGDIARIQLPPPREPRRGVELWRHTCLEAFVAIEGQAAYHEFNFAPSGAWTIYTFSGYRDGAPLADEVMRPPLRVRSDASRLELETFVRLDRVSALHPRAALRIGLAAVIEASDGFSYWALHHPLNKPDFHRAEGFTLRIEPARPDV